MNRDSTCNALPLASDFFAGRTGNPLLLRSNKLPDMPHRNKRRPEDVLAENYVRLKERLRAAGVWKGPGVSSKTANNVAKARHNTKLETIVRLANALGVDPYQMLIPAEDEKFLAVLQAWAQSDETGRDNLHVIAEAMLKRKSENALPDAAAPHRKGNRSR